MLYRRSTADVCLRCDQLLSPKATPHAYELIAVGFDAIAATVRPRFPAGSFEFQKYRHRGRQRAPAPSTLAAVDVFFEVADDLLTLPEGQATILAEKLRLFAAGQFRDDVRKLEELGTSRAWLAGTREAADLIELALVDERSGPVPLARGDVAAAVLQVLRLSYVDASTRAGAVGLVEALQALSQPDG
jgi:hypothetical protein